MSKIDLNSLFSYLASTDQLDDLLGLKHDNIANCPKCNEELLIYEDNILYCPRCNELEEYKLNRSIDNKKLTLEQKRMIIKK